MGQKFISLLYLIHVSIGLILFLGSYNPSSNHANESGNAIDFLSPTISTTVIDTATIHVNSTPIHTNTNETTLNQNTSTVVTTTLPSPSPANSISAENDPSACPFEPKPLSIQNIDLSSEAAIAKACDSDAIINISDADFRTCIAKEYLILPENNLNQPITQRMACEIKKIICEDYNITDYTGLENFFNLTLFLTNKNSKKINLEYMPNLKTVFIDGGAFSSLCDLRLPRNLDSLNIGNAHFTEIDFGKVPKLSSLHIEALSFRSFNGLEKLTMLSELLMRKTNFEYINFTGLKNLNYLILHDNNHINEIINLEQANQLIWIDITKNKAPLNKIEINNFEKMIFFIINDSDISTVTLGSLPNLLSIGIQGSKLKELNLSNLPKLRSIIVLNNQLKKIAGLEQFSQLENLDLQGNPDFDCANLKLPPNFNTPTQCGMPYVPPTNPINTLP